MFDIIENVECFELVTKFSKALSPKIKSLFCFQLSIVHGRSLDEKLWYLNSFNISWLPYCAASNNGSVLQIDLPLD